MIKDRAIQKRIKGKVVAMAMTAVVASLFVPVEVKAVDIGRSTNAKVVLDTDGYYFEGSDLKTNCFTEPDGSCEGHIFTGATGASQYGIEVKGGTHTITLNGVTIDTSQAGGKGAALSVGADAVLNLKLQGINKLTSANTYAGISVPTGATLNISEVKDTNNPDGGSLVAKSMFNGAGIGGDGAADASAGNITIESGTITAVGGSGGAGIGGSGNGSAGNIKINGGSIKALGGNGSNEAADSKKYYGAPGIGGGNESQINQSSLAGGSITINGGNVTAWGGTGVNNLGQANGVAANTLSSDPGSTAVVLTNGFRNNMHTNSFNGLRWSASKTNGTDTDGEAKIEKGKACTVYGDVTLPNDFKALLEGETLEIPGGCSLTIPTEWTEDWLCNGTVSGDGKLINADKIRVNVKGKLDIKDENMEVILLAKDIDINRDLIFTGDDLSSQVCSIHSTREGANGKLYRVNQDGWGRSYIQPDLTTGNTVKNAGDYTLQFTKSGCASVIIPFVVASREISECNPVKIDSVDYTGKKYTQADIRPYLTYGTYELQSADYNLDFDTYNNTNAGEAKIKISGATNFTGNMDVTYTINRASLANTEEKEVTKVTLSGSDGTYTDIRYDGATHRPDQQTVTLSTLKTDDKTLVKDNDYIVEYYRGDKKLDVSKPDDFKDAGEITVRITGTGNFQDSVDKIYIIKPIMLPVKSIKAESRKYDGTTKVTITEITVDEESKSIIDSDKGQVKAEASKLKGTIDKADVGTYTSIKFEGDDALLSGDRGSNYTIEGQTYSAPQLQAPVVITKGDAPEITLTGKQEVSTKDSNTFSYTVEASGKLDPSSEYWYCMTEEGAEEPDPATAGFDGPWQREPTFDELTPEGTYVFYAFANETSNVEQSQLGVDSHTFNLLPRETGPSVGGTLVINEQSNEELDIEPYDEAFTAIINNPPGDNGPFLYSFDGGKTYGPENVKKDCQPGETYTAYIKYAKSTVYLENDDAQGTPGNTVDAPTLKAKTPTITTSAGVENGGTFNGRTNVIITYPGRSTDMTIYYTTDGNRPGRDSEQLASGESFPINATTTVKAIAVKGNMEDSDVAEATFTAADATEVTEATVTGLTDDKIPDSLKIQLEEGEDPISNAESLKAYLNKRLRTLNSGYEYDNVAYYDLKVEIKSYTQGSSTPDIVPATQDDFPRSVRLTFDKLRSADEKFPDLTGDTKYDLVAVHMFSGDFEKFPAGQIENITNITQGENYIEFEVSGASPLAIGWKVSTNPDDPNNPDDPTNPDDPNNPDDPTNPDDPNNPDDPTNPDDPNNPNDSDNQDPNSPGNQNGDGSGTNGTTSSTDAATQGASDDSKSALSDIMPKTGDPISFIPWIAAAVVSIGVIVGLVKKKGGKKSPKKNAKKTTKKTTKSTKKKK